MIIPSVCSQHTRSWDGVDARTILVGSCYPFFVLIAVLLAAMLGIYYFIVILF
jgi:hypothetical protein